MSDWFDQYYGCNGPCSEYERLVNTPQIYSSITQDYQSCLPTPAPFDCSLISHCVSGGTFGDTFIVSGNADAATSLLTFTYNTGGTITVTNSAALFSDNDINVTGGTYNPSNGCVTFGTNSGTTFDVCGFVSGITDTYTTGSTLVGETIQFDNNILGLNYYNVSLSPVLSGKTNNSTFNSYTSNTQTILNSKVSGATNLSTTGLFAQKVKHDLEFKGLTSTGGTVTISNDSTTVNLEVVTGSDTNTFVSGGTYNDTTYNINFSGNSLETTFDVDLTSLVSSVSGDTFVTEGNYSNSTDTINLVRNDGVTIGISGVTDTFTTGSTYDNSTATATFTRNDGNTYTLDLSTIDDNDTFVTGFTYNNANTFTISRNDGVDLNSSFNTVTGLTVNGTLNATTILSGGTNLTTIIESLNTNTFVSGGTYNDTTNNINFSGNSLETTFDVDLTSLVSSVSANTFVISGTYVDSTDTLALLRNDGNFVNITGITDTFTTGATYDNGTALATFNRNDGNSYTLDLSTIDVNDTFSTGGTVTQSSSNNENNQTIQIVGNGGFTPYNITNVTDKFTTGGTYNNGTALITFDKNDGTTYDVDLSTLDLNNTFVTGTTFSSNQAVLKRNDGLEVFKFSGGSNVNLSNPSTNQIKIDVSLPATTNTFVTGFTYNDANTFTISDNNGDTFSTSINIMTGLTVTSLSGVNTIQDDGGELTIISDDLKIKGDTITIQDNGGNDKIIIDSTVTTPELSGKISFNDNQTFSSNVFVNNVLTATTISATTYFGDGSNLTGIPDNYVTGGTVSGTNLLLGRNGGLPNVIIDTSAYFDDTDNYVTGATMNVNTLELSRSGGLSNVSVDLSQFVDVNDGVVSGATMNSNTLELGRTQGLSNVTVDLSQFIDTNTFVTGFTYNNNNTFTISDNAGSSFPATISQVSGLTVNGTLSATTLDGSILLSGGTNLLTIIESLDTNTFVSGGTYNDTTNKINFSGNSLDTTFDVDLTSLVSSVSANTFVIAGTYVDSTNTISLLRNDGNFVNVTGVTNTYVTGGTVSILATDSDNDSTIGLFYKDSDGTPRTLPFKDTFITGGTYDNGSTTIEFTKNNSTKFDVDLSSLINSVSGDTFVVSGNADASTSLLTFTNNSGGTFNVTNSAALFSDNDINVTGGTYNSTNGCITFGTNSGTTFDVCGFVTGFTDSYTTDAYLSGTEVRFDNSVEGTNYYNVDLLPVLSGKTDLTLFNSHTADTSNPHQTSFSNLTSTAHTHTISDIINLQTELDSKLDITTFNTYTAYTQTKINDKIDSANNVGGANELFKDKSGTTLNFRTISGGSNTTISTLGDVVKVDVTIPTDTNTFVTGGTYNDTTYNINFSGNSTETNFDVDLTTLISSVSGGTGGSVTPILIVSNSTYIPNPVVTQHYLGNKTMGFSGGEWNVTTSGFRTPSINCGVPLPHSIDSGVSDAINVCGNLYIAGTREIIYEIEIKVHVFDCPPGIVEPTLVELGSITVTGETRTNKCWSIDVDSGDDALTECTTHLVVSIGVVSAEAPSSLKSSYKATIEKIT